LSEHVEEELLADIERYARSDCSLTGFGFTFTAQWDVLAARLRETASRSSSRS
jgi:hypothetical protein